MLKYMLISCVESPLIFMTIMKDVDPGRTRVLFRMFENVSSVFKNIFSCGKNMVDLKKHIRDRVGFRSYILYMHRGLTGGVTDQDYRGSWRLNLHRWR